MLCEATLSGSHFNGTKKFDWLQPKRPVIFSADPFKALSPELSGRS